MRFVISCQQIFPDFDIFVVFAFFALNFCFCVYKLYKLNGESPRSNRDSGLVPR